jgi:carbonic anhydrase
MKSRIRVSALVAAVFLISLAVSANGLWSFEKTHPLSPETVASPLAKADETLKKLMDGNQHFASGQPAQKDIGAVRRAELVKGQSPSVVVLSCSDSRVPPELIFDQGLGDIFVVRVAGNVADPVALGSIEYAVEHIHVPLIIVMGHDRCGAVTATIDGGKPEGNIRAIVRKIAPAVRRAKTTGKKGDDLLEAAVIENAWNVMTALTRESKIIKHLVDENKLKIVAAKYSLQTGKVELLEPSKGH